MVEGGKHCNMLINAEILKVTAPKKFVKGGPYCVVHKEHTSDSRYAIVTLDWGISHCLGIRHFTGKYGVPHCEFPQSSVNQDLIPEWLIIPDIFYNSILRELLNLNLIVPAMFNDVTQFLSGTMTGAALQAKYP